MSVMRLSFDTKYLFGPPLTPQDPLPDAWKSAKCLRRIDFVAGDAP